MWNETSLDITFEDEKDLVAKKMNVQVVGIVDAFPGYNRYYYKEDEFRNNNQNYLYYANEKNHDPYGSTGSTIAGQLRRKQSTTR